MDKYIKESDLFKRILNVDFNHDYDGCIKFCHSIPAADVQEVRHGEWVFKFYCGNMSGYDYGMTCSVCGKPTHRQFAEKMPPFCPNCGSRMDLDGDTE